jgi:pyruvate-formate lyase
MKIDGPGTIRPTRPRARRSVRDAAGGRFASQVSTEPQSATARLGPVAVVNQVDGILALQEVPGAADGRSKGISRGADLLDRLDEIRHALLRGAVSRDQLVELHRRVVAQKTVVDDARLSTLLDEIDLRASVELAKLGIAP